MAKFFPVIGEVYTAVESGFCAYISGCAKLAGDDKASAQWMDSARNAWVEYSEDNCISNTVLKVAHASNGNWKEAQRLNEKMGNNIGKIADGTPVVGHVKGIVHYATGDTEKGNRCMEAATRTTAVLGAGVLTGGLGAPLAAGAVAGVGTGLAYDGAATLIDKAANDEKATLHGSFALIEANKMSPNEITQTLMGVAGDGLTGYGGAKLGRSLRTHWSGQQKLENAYTEAGVEDPKQATKLTMETAQAAEEAQAVLDREVNGCTTKVVDKTNGNSGVGHSEQIRRQMRMQNWEENGFRSRRHAGNATNSGTASHLQTAHPEVMPDPARNIAQNACAEHQAFDNYSKNNPGYTADNTRTATVYHYKHNGTFGSIQRCDNCAGYGSAMGEVVTDKIPHNTYVPAENYLPTCSSGEALGGASAGVALQLVRQTRSRYDYAKNK